MKVSTIRSNCLMRLMSPQYSHTISCSSYSACIVSLSTIDFSVQSYLQLLHLHFQMSPPPLGLLIIHPFQLTHLTLHPNLHPTTLDQLQSLVVHETSSGKSKKSFSSTKLL